VKKIILAATILASSVIGGALPAAAATDTGNARAEQAALRGPYYFFDFYTRDECVRSGGIHTRDYNWARYECDRDIHIQGRQWLLFYYLY
jgi:hypothetical protein